jgi:ketosteroid isomerase-like protein
LIVARWTLRLGVIAAFGALLTGYLASGSVIHDDVSHANMIVHRNWALATSGIFLIIALMDYLKRSELRISILSTLLLVSGAVTLAITGLEGAENVYKYGLGVQQLPDVSTHEHSGGEESSVHEHASEASSPDEHEVDSGAHDHEPARSSDTVSNDGHEHSHAGETKAKDSQEPDHPASLLADQLAEAIMHGDVDSLRAIVAPEVLIFESGGVESSLVEYEGHHMLADMEFMKAMDREAISQQMKHSDDLATVFTRSRISGSYKSKEIDVYSTETLVMRKMNGKWKVVHIHWSSGD